MNLPFLGKEEGLCCVMWECRCVSVLPFTDTVAYSCLLSTEQTWKLFCFSSCNMSRLNQLESLNYFATADASLVHISFNWIIIDYWTQLSLFCGQIFGTLLCGHRWCIDLENKLHLWCGRLCERSAGAICSEQTDGGWVTSPPPLRSQLANTTVCVLLIASRKEAVCVSADILKVRWSTSVGNSWHCV